MKITRRSTRFGLLLTAASVASVAAFAAAPPAGERIGNQASATYVNAANDVVTVTSNRVETVVQQVAGILLAADTSETAAPGGKVFIPHILTNTGNGPDIYDLTATDAGGAYTFASIQIFADANRDGVADSTTPITVTPSLDANESYGLIIEAVVPSNVNVNATPAPAATIDLTATGRFDGDDAGTDGDATATNTDTITVSNQAITEVQKDMTVPDLGADGVISSGDIVEITLTFSSTGLADARNLVITDVLDPRLVFLSTEDVLWSDSTTPLDPDNDNDVNTPDGNVTTYDVIENGVGVDFEYFVENGDNTAEFHIQTVEVGRTGFVTFKARIADNVPAGRIDNFATQVLGVDPVPANNVVMPNSNVASVTVEDRFLITIADFEATTYEPDPDTAANLDVNGTRSLADQDSATDDNPGTPNDVVEIRDDAEQGETLAFDFVLTNNSNAARTIDLSFTNNATNGFPAGTSFLLVGSDGVTPVAGSVGPVPADGTTKVTLIATLPGNVAASATNDFNATVTAVASGGGVPNTSTARFTGAITAAAVDLLNDPDDVTYTVGGTDFTTDGVEPNNQSQGGAPYDVKAVDPGARVEFDFTVQNEGATGDNFDLAIAGLPNGYTVVFVDGTGRVITNTGTIPGGGEVDVTAIITPPVGTAPTAPNAPVPFTTSVTSTVSGETDSVVNGIEINTVVAVRIESDQTRQAAASGIIDIPHVITNDSNVVLTEGAVTLGNGLSTFSGTIFLDVNGDQVADSNDIILDNIDDIAGGIAIGGTANIILRVQVPSTATIGAVESVTITVGTVDGSDLDFNGGALTEVAANTGDNTITDTITVVSGDVSLSKGQAVVSCSTGPTLSTTYVSTPVDAKPGDCIAYRITALNSGTVDADTVVISDLTPTWTTYTDCTTASPAGSCAATVAPTSATVSTPATGSAGELTATIGDLIPGAQGTLTFTVKIDE